MSTFRDAEGGNVEDGKRLIKKTRRKSRAWILRLGAAEGPKTRIHYGADGGKKLGKNRLQGR